MLQRSQGTQVRRFRANPIEVTIFSVISLVFVNSMHNLVYEQGGIHPRLLMATSNTPSLDAKRQLASAQTKEFAGLEMTCEQTLSRETQANRIRLRGEICGGDADPSHQLEQIQIIHSVNKFQATVFPDLEMNRYSTDYIPLTSGKNLVNILFQFRDGKSVRQELTLIAPTIAQAEIPETAK